MIIYSNQTSKLYNALSIVLDMLFYLSMKSMKGRVEKTVISEYEQR